MCVCVCVRARASFFQWKFVACKNLSFFHYQTKPVATGGVAQTIINSLGCWNVPDSSSLHTPVAHETSNLKKNLSRDLTLSPPAWDWTKNRTGGGEGGRRCATSHSENRRCMVLIPRLVSYIITRSYHTPPRLAPNPPSPLLLASHPKPTHAQRRQRKHWAFLGEKKKSAQARENMCIFSLLSCHWRKKREIFYVNTLTRKM